MVPTPSTWAARGSGGAAGCRQCDRTDRQGRGVCPPLWRAHPRHAQHPAVGRRTRGRPNVRRELIAAGVDALIVQDMALRRMNLPVELHASTQISNRTPEGARFLWEAGFARGDSGAQPHARRDPRDLPRHDGRGGVLRARCHLRGLQRPLLPVAVDVARSGNRGACSQPCRLTYDLADGRGRTLPAGTASAVGARPEPSEHLGELIDAGVSSFKIEGRLKDLTYIRNVVAYYRRAVDEALAARPQLQRASVGESRPDFDPDPSKSFTRGESEYFFAGKCAGVASFDTPKAVGERIGRAVRVERNAFRLESPGGCGSPRVTASASVRRRALSARTSMRWRVRGSCPTAWRGFARARRSTATTTGSSRCASSAAARGG